MNMLSALTIVRNCSLVSRQIRTKQGRTALKVVDKKLQSLMRKKAWRESSGATPIHMGVDGFTYQIPEDPVTAALRALLAAQNETIGKFGVAEIEGLERAMKQAEAALADLTLEMPFIDQANTQ